MANRKCPKWVRAKLQKALDAANMGTANFGWPHEEVTFHGKTIPLDEFIKEHVRLYNSTWISGPLEDIIEWTDRQKDA